MNSDSVGDTAGAFEMYEAVRHRLPMTNFPSNSISIENLNELLNEFDVFLLDAFGVLNIGETAVPGSQDSIRKLQSAGKIVKVVSNAAGYPKRLLLEKYARLGFGFSPDDVHTSRDVLLDALQSRAPAKLGLMASQAFGKEEIEHLDAIFLAEDQNEYASVDEFVLIGAAEWTGKRQELLENSLLSNPRPVLVGNPDIVAPREGGLSFEPGSFAHRLADVTGVVPRFFGKPFPGIFDMVFSKLPTDTNLDRVLMVGDTLQTDILGGRAAGCKTALVTDFGSLSGLDVGNAIKKSGIVPDYIVPGP